MELNFNIWNLFNLSEHTTDVYNVFKPRVRIVLKSSQTIGEQK